jgi:hypothetical protein
MVKNNFKCSRNIIGKEIATPLINNVRQIKKAYNNRTGHTAFYSKPEGRQDNGNIIKPSVNLMQAMIFMFRARNIM